MLQFSSGNAECFSLMNLKHAVILLVVLVGSDLLIGFVGHYSGTTGGDYTWDGFVDYITHVDPGELGLVFVIAIGILLFLKFVWKRW